ncbi:MAG TPA: RidA family protein [Dehalococcoidia bacterium]|jgi:2-iminobutanoate/2-iminopropanoate deaminase|nr:RidA family protein [Dehalococcoidia bacterium]
MAKQAVSVPWALSGIPYSPGMRAGDYIFVSGQVGHVDVKGNRVEGIEAQTRTALEKVKGVLEAAGASLDDVVKTTVFLVRADDFAKMNEVYKSYFRGDLPSRSTVVVAALVRPEMLVEIECIAYHPR